MYEIKFPHNGWFDQDCNLTDADAAGFASRVSYLLAVPAVTRRAFARIGRHVSSYWLRCHELSS